MRIQPLLIAGVFTFAGLASAAPEVAYLAPADAPKLPAAPRSYQPAEGFGGHKWGEPRAKFARLPGQPQSIRAAWTRGKRNTPEFTCMAEYPTQDQCTFTDVLNSIAATKLHDGGFHVLSEYKIDSQGFRFGETGVLLHPVIYQFCASWNSVERVEPPNFDELNKFCGMRLLFESESLAQLRALPEDHVTRYELVLAELVARHGRPAGLLTRGKVTIESLDDAGNLRTDGDRKFRTWRWCPAMDRAMTTSCESSIVLSIEPESGRALVLYATPALWKYAYAREHQVGGDPLFALMHARQSN